MHLFMAIAERKLAGLPLVRLRRSLEWGSVALPVVAFMYDERGKRKGGQIPFDPVCMARTLLLQRWHGLSDPKMEVALLNRTDFLIFSGFEDDTPDASTICRFRLRLERSGKLGTLFENTDSAIGALGFRIISTHSGIPEVKLAPSLPSYDEISTELDAILNH